jgi:peptidyl-prolyl cis-trans isomerase A (cyclophilin A)
MGRIVIALDRARAPLTTANFLAYVDSGKLDGETFYRAMPYGEGGLIQGGITSDARKL